MQLAASLPYQATTESLGEPREASPGQPRLGRRWLSAVRRCGEYAPWCYAAVLTTGEVLISLMAVSAGMAVHIALLSTLVVHAALCRDFRYSVLYQAMVLAPLVRILSLAMPLSRFPLMYWYLLTGAPLIASSAVAGALAGFGMQKIGLCRGRPSFQALVALSGVPLGLMEYFILRPAPLIGQLNFASFWLPALLLLTCTGFVEEFMFRGVLQRAASPFGDRFALLFVSLIFAVLHITHRSVLDVVFVFGVALLFGRAVQKDGSILGVSIAHGLTNIGLYLIWPFFF